jgi:hypothetical protein
VSDDVIVFGDDEPEDAWDPGDPVPVLVDDLIRRVELLIGHGFRTGAGDTSGTLDAIADAVAAERARRVLEGHDLERADELNDDIATVRGRL